MAKGVKPRVPLSALPLQEEPPLAEAKSRKAKAKERKEQELRQAAESALAAVEKGKGKGKTGGKGSKSKNGSPAGEVAALVCWGCGHAGHSLRDCRKTPNDKKGEIAKAKGSSSRGNTPPPPAAGASGKKPCFFHTQGTCTLGEKCKFDCGGVAKAAVGASLVSSLLMAESAGEHPAGNAGECPSWLLSASGDECSSASDELPSQNSTGCWRSGEENQLRVCDEATLLHGWLPRRGESVHPDSGLHAHRQASSFHHCLRANCGQ